MVLRNASKCTKGTWLVRIELYLFLDPIIDKNDAQFLDDTMKSMGFISNLNKNCLESFQSVNSLIRLRKTNYFQHNQNKHTIMAEKKEKNKQTVFYYIGWNNNGKFTCCGIIGINKWKRSTALGDGKCFDDFVYPENATV